MLISRRHIIGAIPLLALPIPALAQSQVVSSADMVEHVENYHSSSWLPVIRDSGHVFFASQSENYVASYRIGPRRRKALREIPLASDATVIGGCSLSLPEPDPVLADPANRSPYQLVDRAIQQMVENVWYEEGPRGVAGPHDRILYVETSEGVVGISSHGPIGCTTIFEASTISEGGLTVIITPELLTALWKA